MSHSPTFRIFAILTLVTLLLSACGTLKNNNFNRQKYTKLKKVESHSEPFAEIERPDESDSDFGGENEETSIENPFVSDNLSQGFETEQKGLIDEIHISTSYQEDEGLGLEGELINPEKMIGGNPEAVGNKDFKTFTQEEKNKAIIQFNALFNAGLALIIAATVLFILAGVLSVSTTTPLVFIFASIGGVFIFTAWIISLVALNKVRRIKKQNFVGDLGIKVWLARLVAFIGIAACIITILGGILLGILYLARLI